MKKRTRKILTCLLAPVLVFSAAMTVRGGLDKAGGRDSYEAALQAATAVPAQTAAPAETTADPVTEPKLVLVPEPVTDDANLEALADIHLESLRQTNADVVGWIYLPDSKINYPVMQGEDNDFYLNHTWEKRRNSVGSIYLECRNSADMTDYNTIVYGHNMKDGSMFAGLRKYAAGDYWEKHPYVYLLTDSGVLRYEVFSSYEADVSSITYGLSFRQAETRTEFLTMALQNSRIDTGIVPNINDRILTLSTCSGAGYSTRWVVHARLKMIQVPEA